MATSPVRLFKRPRARRTALLVLIWAVIVGALFAVREVLLPFFIAIFLAYVMNPVVDRLSTVEWKERKLPRWGSVLTVYLGALVFVWGSAVFVVPQLYGEVERLARSTVEALSELDEERIEKLANRLDGYAQRMSLPVRVVADGGPTGSGLQPKPPPAGLAKPVGEEEHEDPLAVPLYTVDLNREARTLASGALDVVQASTGQIASRLQAVVGGVLGFVFKIFLVLMVTAFLVSDKERIERFFFTLVPVEDRGSYDDLLGRIDRGLSGVVRGQLTICFVNGVLTLVGLLLFQVKFAFILATMAAVFSLIPIFGSIASTIPIVFVALATSGWFSAILMLVWIVGIHLLEANFLNPKIMGDAAKIHPVVIVVALIAGEHFYGVVGALFAVPIMSIALTLFKSILQRAQNLQQQLGKTRQQAALGPPRRVAHKEPLV